LYVHFSPIQCAHNIYVACKLSSHVHLPNTVSVTTCVQFDAVSC
jgi:hypothetical protein